MVEVSDFVYIGRQETDVSGVYVGLFNCLRCGTTIVESSQLEHIVKYHPKVWEEKEVKYEKRRKSCL